MGASRGVEPGSCRVSCSCSGLPKLSCPRLARVAERSISSVVCWAAFGVLPFSQSRPLSKTSSLANLSDAKDKISRSDGGGGGSGVLLGKPPTAPHALVTPVAVMLPKLQELLDHASAHQAALQASGDTGSNKGNRFWGIVRLRRGHERRAGNCQVVVRWLYARHHAKIL